MSGAEPSAAYAHHTQVVVRIPGGPMEAIFFVARREDALGVSSWSDLPVEPAAEPIQIKDPAALRALARALGAEERLAMLSDATCRSFPVWSFHSGVSQALANLEPEKIDAVAESWLEAVGGDGMDADLYELSTLIGDLRRTLQGAADPDEVLFVLLEEKAF